MKHKVRFGRHKSQPKQFGAVRSSFVARHHRLLFALVALLLCVSPIAAVSAVDSNNSAAPGTLTGDVVEDANANMRLNETESANTTGTTADTSVNSHTINTCVEGNNDLGGSVFQDFNSNGAVDPGDVSFDGVTVTAYNNDGNAVTVPVNSDGTYVFPSIFDNDTHIRLEFSGLPSWAESSFAGANNGTTVQIHDGATCGADLAIQNPVEYCQNDPVAGLTCFPVNGGSDGNDSAFITVGSTSSGSDPSLKSPDVPETIAGATWGVGYDRVNNDAYIGSVLKRHSDFGQLGIGGLYKVEYDANGNVQQVVQWATVPNAGTMSARNLPVNDTSATYDAEAYGLVGKVGLGGVEVTYDGSTLYVMNLNNNGSLVEYDTATATINNTYPVDDPGCAAATDVRPWATHIDDASGAVYIGVVCSEESTQADADMVAYIMELTPGAGLGNFTVVTSVPLDYLKDPVAPSYSGCTHTNQWYAWDSDPNNFGSQSNPDQYCQTVNFGAEQDVLGYPMPILADIERDTDGSFILGFTDRFALQTGQGNYPPDATGTSTELYTSNSGGDILRICDVNGVYVPEGSAGCPYNNGSTEYYSGDDFRYGATGVAHAETALGGLALLSSADDLLAIVYDPIDDLAQNNDQFATSGIVTLDNTTGLKEDSYRVVEASQVFGKAGSLGDIELFCDLAPVQIGNYVWFDQDKDGIQDPCEPALDGVDVVLTDANGVMTTTTTNADGEYYFTVEPNSTYTLTIDMTQAALPTYTVTTANVDSGTTISDSVDSDATRNGNLATIVVTTGDVGENDHTLDFGFIEESSEGVIGDLVFHDQDGDGIYNPAIDNLIPGVVVSLTNSAGDVITTVTGADGRYEFSELSYDIYTVTVDTSDLPTGKSSVPTGNSSNTADDTGEGTTSITIELTETMTENFTADFSFGPLGTLGNTIFHDIDGDGEYNPGIGDFPLSGVDVTLTDEDGNQVTVQTDGNGFYEFAGLDLNEMYTVTMDVSDLPNSKNPNPTSGTGADQVSSGTVTLTTTLTSDNRQDPTLDFGFEPYGEIGNQLFHDVDGDGVFEPAMGEFPLSGVDVILTDSNGMTEIVTTDLNGNYLFDQLPLQETYTVTVDTDTLPANKVNIPTTAPDPNNPAIDVSSGANELVTTLTYLDPVDETVDFGYEPLVPSIDIVKLAGSAADNTVYTITVPSVVTYSYIIQNTGETHLINTIVTDDLGTESIVDDVTISAANCPALAAAEPLAPLEQVVCEIGLFVDRDVTNVADVIADPSEPDGTPIPNLDPPTDDDPAEVVYDRPIPAIKIIKTAGTAADGQTYIINDLGMVTFFYTVTNIGETYLQDVTIVDDNSTPNDTSDDVNVSCAGLTTPLAPGDSVSCSAQIMVNGNHLNVATTEGVPADSDGNEIEELENPTDNDPAAVEYAPDGSIGNLIFHDADRDGVFEPQDGDFPLDGVEVTLTASDGTTQTLITDITGNYLFTGLPFDTYTVTVDTDTLPNNKLESPPSYDPEGDGDSTATVTITPDNPSDVDQDFGYEPLGTLGSTIFHDIDGDGVYEPNEGDFPLSGVVISLDTPTGVITTMTNGDGQYEFIDLPFNETYTVTVDTATLPDSKNGNATGDSTLTADETSEGTNVLTTTLTADNPEDDTLDFGYEPLGVIGDTIFHDANNDGVYDPNDGDAPLPNVDVILTDVATGITTTASTNAFGQYFFEGLPFGDYTVEVDTSTLPGDKISSPTSDPEGDGDNISAVTLTPESPSDLDQDFGYQPEGTLGNTIFHDADGDGVYEPNDGDFPLEGVEVTLTLPDGSTQTTTTDGNGFYEFTDLALDETYAVTVNTNTLPDSKNDDATGSGGNSADQTSEGTITLTTTLTSGTAGMPSDPTLDFGFEPLGSLGSTIFHDTDGDGIYEPNDGDFPLDGVVVELTDSNGNTVTTTTDINGQYRFDGLPLDETYTVSVDTTTLPDSKWEGATGDSGLTADETSEGTETLSTTLTVDLVEDTTLDFGFQPKGVIGDFIFHDADGDGIYEPNGGDFPLEGVVVELENSNGDIVTAMSDINGEYLFTELPFDDYTVTVDPTTLPDTKTPNPTSDPEGDGNNSSSVSLTPDNPSDLDQDFSYQPLGTLGNTIFHDIDADGVYDPSAGDFPLDGVTVELTYPNGTTATTTTDGNGFYEFTDLPLNETYTIEVDTSSLPVSKNPDATGDSTNTDDQTSEGTITLSTTLTDDEPSDPTLDVGFAPYGAIGDTIFHDVDGDGVYEPDQGEFPLDGVEVILTDANGVTQTTTTDTNGNYLFNGLEFGDYTVEVNADTLPDGKAPQPTADPENDQDNISSVTLTPADPEDLDQDFGYQPLGALGSTVFHDVNNDGVYDPTAGDFPLNDILVTLMDDSGNVITTTTDGDGFYQFTDLALEETYTVTIDTGTLPETKDPTATGDSGNSTDETSEGVSVLTTTLTADAPNDPTLDFGYQPLGTVGTTIFHDLDADGVYEPSLGEFPLEGVVVTLEGSDGTMLTTTTDELGNYQFTGLALDETYTVTVDANTLPESKAPGATGDDSLTDDQTSEGVLTLTTMLTTDMPNDPTLDFGFQSKGAIGDFIFHDLDGDGVFDPNDGEFPLEGVEIILTDENGNTQTTTTDQNGFYEFTELQFGDYTVDVNTSTLPDGKSVVPSADPEGDNNSSSSVTLTPEEPQDYDQDFGYQPLGAIGSLLFHDVDGDGVYELNDGEFPLEGVVLILTDGNGVTQTTTTDETGFYQFTDLPLDETYSVSVDTTTLPDTKSPDPTGDSSLTADQTSEGVLTLETTLTPSDPNDQTLDFGFQAQGEIGDFIFHDLDGDGVYEPENGEFPLVGVNVVLTDEDGNQQIATTDELGNYLFSNLPLDATYTIAVDETTLPSSKDVVPSADPENDGNNESMVTLTADNPNDYDQDFGYQPNGALGSTVFHDVNFDGVYDPTAGDFPLADVVVTLTDESGNTQTMTTDANGFYQFTELPLGVEYTVTVDTTSIPDNKDPQATGDDSLTGDQTSEGVSTLTTVLTADSPTDQTLDFGYQPLGTLGTTIFHDSDGDGVYEPSEGEFPLENVTVMLVDENGNVQTTTTDALGNYAFTGLPLDTTYTVTVDANTIPSSKAIGATGDDSLTADQTSEGVLSLTTTLTGDMPSDPTLDFGFQPAGIIGDFIFHDLDGDGVYEPNDGEFPLQGVVVTLEDEDGNVQTTTTDELGNYLFDELPLDATYIVTVDETTLPDGKQLVPSADPENDGNNTSTVTLTADDPDDLDQDFGYQPLGALGSLVFHDQDADGIYEPQDGDFPLDNVTVLLTDEDGNTQTTTTDANGFYQFTDLPLDAMYTVAIDTGSLPDSKLLGATGDSSLVSDQTSEGVIELETTLTADQPNDQTLDFGFQPKGGGVIGDFIFHDLDGDGVYEPLDGEFVLPGVTVVLTDENGNMQSMMTDENGNYLFTDLEFGEYEVMVNTDTLPGGKSPVPSADPENDGNNTSTVLLTSDDPSDLDQDFGYQPLGVLGSLVFHDQDSDGIYEPQDGDFPLADVTVTLTDEDGNTQTRLTDQNGFYQFTELLLDATYVVSINTSSLPDGKAPSATGNSGLTADQTSEGVIELETTLTADQPNDQTLDFGFQPNGLIGDFIFHDADGDGTFDPNDGEFPLEGVEVTLTDSDGNGITTTTDINGMYLFTDIPFGDYTVTVNTDTLPEGKSAAPTSDPEGDGDNTSNVTLTADNPNDLEQDFSYRPLGELGTFLFHDTDGDGVYDPTFGEFPLAGIRVVLSDETGVIGETTTDNLGQYLFSDLPLGKQYTVTVDTTTLPENKEPVATDGRGMDDDSNGSNVLTTMLTADAPADYTLDFGYQPRGTIGNFIFQDVDGDGQYEPEDGEYPLVGVTVMLTDENLQIWTTETDQFGFYQFTGLPFGTYAVSVDTTTLPEGKIDDSSFGVDSVGGNTAATQLTAENPSDNTLNFGYEPVGYISTRFFHDFDGDGVYSPADGDTPLEGVEVILTLSDGTVFTTTTDVDGFYRFANMSFDNYTVTFNQDTLPEDKLPEPTTESDAFTFGLSIGNPTQTDLNFGFQSTGSIGDIIFHDANGNGVYEPELGDEPLEGVGVTLTTPDGVTATMMTDENGRYMFSNLLSGEYTVTIDETTLPVDKVVTSTSSTVVLTPDTPSDLTLDFGYAPRLGQVDGTIFHDVDRDGIYEPEEGDFLLDDVVVSAQSETGVVMTTTTDSNGYYAFPDLPLDALYTISVDMMTLPADKFPEATDGAESVGTSSYVLFLADVESDPNVDNFDEEATVPFGFAEAKPTSVSVSNFSASTVNAGAIVLMFVGLVGVACGRKRTQ